ncbi:hypothetical protein [Pedobacter nototheniae]|uniref:hypothetical protein n=1 Tax=Pedobacter nototheniae TaxID=2488994 RepID=UPI002930EAAA|nr:hypothetical protein [Pedobacter nototheniae]
MKFKLKPLQKQFLLTLSIASLCLASFNGFGQIKDSVTLNSLINKKSFTYNKDVFNGVGWELLKNEIEKVQFVMIGEQHGEAEIPVFTEKIATLFKPKAFVAEIDPYSAVRLKKLAIDPAGYSAHFKKWPYDLAFYCWDTEMKLAKKLSEDHVDIWGLNEITFMSAGLFFEELANVSKIPANKALAKKIAVEYGNNDRPMYFDSKKWDNLSFSKLTTGHIDTLLTVFKDDNVQAKKMLFDLKASRPLLWANYSLRINMMKKNLLNYVAPYIGKDAVSIPKLLFKFGANHVTRTNDITGLFEVGNLADHLAAASNKKTLHILIFGKNGTINSMISPDNSKAIQPYKIENDKDLSIFTPFYNQLSDQEWAFFDLRPIRTAILKGTIKGVNTNLEAFIKGYDVLVLFSPTTGNKFIE